MHVVAILDGAAGSAVFAFNDGLSVVMRVVVESPMLPQKPLPMQRQLLLVGGVFMFEYVDLSLDVFLPLVKEWETM